MEPNPIVIAVFVFAFGACVGSFLNVVVYRMPLGKSLVTPPSACPNCGHRLAWHDNLPVVGWLILRGRCRYCRTPISSRYPLVELLTAVLFVAHYYLLFHARLGPYAVDTGYTIFGTAVSQFRYLVIERDWPLLVLHLWLIGALLAASLIDFAHFIIPLGICWWTAIVGGLVHALGRPDGSLGSVHFDPAVDAMALGGGVGLLIAIALMRRGWLRQSFADSEPLMEKDVVLLPEDQRPDPWPPARIRREMRLEMLFVLPVIVGAAALWLVTAKVPAAAAAWAEWSGQRQFSGVLGALCGGLVGGGVVWLFRILGSYGFGREAMGLGDVHLMFGVGCCLGPGPAVAAFFIAPAFGLVLALTQFLAKGRRELPYGPYLALGTYVVMLFYGPIYDYFAPGLSALVWAGQTAFGGGNGVQSNGSVP